MTSLQIFPELDAATEAALRASIAKHGVLVPVAVDQDGRVLDGHHRSRIASELDVPFDTIQHFVSGDEHAREIARTLNEDRRQLPVEQRREVVADLREQGHSTRAIAGAVGVSHTQVRRDISGGTLVPPVQAEQVSPSAHVSPNGDASDPGTTPERVTGTDGKSYPAAKPKAEDDPATAWFKAGAKAQHEAQSELHRLHGASRPCRKVDYELLSEQVIHMSKLERQMLSGAADTFERAAGEIRRLLEPKLGVVK